MATKIMAAAPSKPLGDSTRVTLAGDYTYTKGFNVVADGNNGGLAQTDRDGFMNKTLYGALEHAFSDQWSGFVRGYGYSNRTAYDGYYSSFTPDVLVDTRQLYSQTGTLGCALIMTSSIHNFSPATATAKIITTTRIWDVMIPMPRWMRSNSTTCSGPTPLRWAMAILAQVSTGRSRAPNQNKLCHKRL